MTFFLIELLYSVMISSESKDDLFLGEIFLVIPSRDDFVEKFVKHTIIFLFYFNIEVLCSIRFSITPFSTLTLESEVEKEEEEKEGQSVTEEEEIEMRFEDETVEQLEEEEEVVLTSDGESETTSEDENEFLGDFSNTNCESFVLYR